MIYMLNALYHLRHIHVYLSPIFGGKSTWPLFKISLPNKAIFLHNTSIMHSSCFNVLLSAKESKNIRRLRSYKSSDLQIFKCHFFFNSALPAVMSTTTSDMRKAETYGERTILKHTTSVGIDSFLEVFCQCAKLIWIIKTVNKV